MRRRRATLQRGTTVALRWHRRADCAPVSAARPDPHGARRFRGPFITAEDVKRALMRAKATL